MAHNFELDAVLTFGAAGKDLASKQRNLMRKPVAFMRNPVDAALRHNFVGAEFLGSHQPVPIFTCNRSDAKTNKRVVLVDSSWVRQKTPIKKCADHGTYKHYRTGFHLHFCSFFIGEEVVGHFECLGCQSDCARLKPNIIFNGSGTSKLIALSRNSRRCSLP